MKQGKRVVIIDGDAQCSVTQHLLKSPHEVPEQETLAKKSATKKKRKLSEEHAVAAAADGQAGEEPEPEPPELEPDSPEPEGIFPDSLRVRQELLWQHARTKRARPFDVHHASLLFQHGLVQKLPHAAAGLSCRTSWQLECRNTTCAKCEMICRRSSTTSMRRYFSTSQSCICQRLSCQGRVLDAFGLCLALPWYAAAARAPAYATAGSAFALRDAAGGRPEGANTCLSATW